MLLQAVYPQYAARGVFMFTDIEKMTDKGSRTCYTAKRGLFSKRKIPTLQDSEERELARYITQAKAEWLDASASFEHAYEAELVDYFTYKIKACECRYTYFINLAKKKGFSQS